MSRTVGMGRVAPRTRRLSALVAAVLLAACSAPMTRVAPSADPLERQRARERALQQQPHWSLRGKIAVSDGRDGGSGRIDWRQQGADFRIEIRAPVSRRTWRLTRTATGARLDGVDAGARSGPDAERLLHEAVGWSVPLSDLAAWVRGARGAGDARIEFDSAQRPARIVQHGWTVEYRAWDGGSPALPLKVFASRGDRRVRLLVERWNDGER